MSPEDTAIFVLRAAPSNAHTYTLTQTLFLRQITLARTASVLIIKQADVINRLFTFCSRLKHWHTVGEKEVVSMLRAPFYSIDLSMKPAAIHHTGIVSVAQPTASNPSS